MLKRNNNKRIKIYQYLINKLIMIMILLFKRRMLYKALILNYDKFRKNVRKKYKSLEFRLVKGNKIKMKICLLRIVKKN